MWRFRDWVHRETAEHPDVSEAQLVGRAREHFRDDEELHEAFLFMALFRMLEDTLRAGGYQPAPEDPGRWIKPAD